MSYQQAPPPYQQDGYKAPAGPYQPPPAGQYQQPPQGPYPPPAGGYQPQPGYAPPPQGNVTVVTQQQPVVVAGGCPACRVGHVREEFTALGIILAILFFPLGVLCCFLLMEKRCSNCGASF